MRIIGDLVLAGFGQLKNARIENVSTDPAVPQNGQVWFNTSDSVYRGFNGTAVITFANGGNTQTIIDSLAAETSARIAGDSDNAAGDAAEASARIAGDATNAAAIAAEETARAAGDATNAAAVAAETTARTSGDSTLQSNLDTEATARAAADTAETSARIAGDATNASAVSAETTARTSADATLQSNLDTEATARAAGDATNAAAVSTEATARAAGDATNAAAIAAETTARSAADTAEANARIAEDGSIRTDMAALISGGAGDAAALVATEASARAAGDALLVAKAGDSMSGNLAFGGLATVTGLTAPVNAADAATKNYVDSTVSGLSWKHAVNGTGATNPGTASTGTRFLNTTDGKIYTATATDTFNAGVAAVDGDAVFDGSTETGYVFSGSAWTVFTGTGMIAAGVGLSKTGNQIDVNLGAGIAQLPSDEVGLDVRSTGGVFLTSDGTTPSTDTDAQLAIRLDGATLTLSGTGVRVAASVISELSAATTAIDVETSARVAAVAAEASTRAAADTAAAAAAAAESTARVAAEATLQANIDAEASARVAGDASGSSAVSTEATARAAGDAANAAALATETTARTSADTALAAAASTESTARVAAEATLQANIDAEATARAAGDATGIAAVSTEATARAAADTAEASARAAGDATEASARTAADTALSDRINGGYFLYDGSSSSASHSVNHAIGTKYCQVLVVDSADKVIIPDAITFVDANNLTVDFISAITCKVVVSAIKA